MRIVAKVKHSHVTWMRYNLGGVAIPPKVVLAGTRNRDVEGVIREMGLTAAAGNVRERNEGGSVREARTSVYKVSLIFLTHLIRRSFPRRFRSSWISSEHNIDHPR